MRKYLAGGLVFSLVLFATVSSARAADLGLDVMRPLARSLVFVGRFRSDPARAAEVAAQASLMVGYVDLGLTLEPATQAYVALGAEIGAENAKRKYIGVMEVLRGAILQLQARTAAVPSGAACGDPCGALLDEMHSIETLGHNLFTDPSNN